MLLNIYPNALIQPSDLGTTFSTFESSQRECFNQSSMARKKCTHGICNWPGLKFWTKDSPTIVLRSFRLAMNGIKMQKVAKENKKEFNNKKVQ